MVKKRIAYGQNLSVCELREAALRKFVPAIFFGLVLILGAGMNSAQAGDVTFKLTNKARYSIIIKFFSQDRDWVWPGPTKHWTLDDNGEHDFRLSCVDGEKVCYGGAYDENDKTYWGLGFKGNKGCKGCCLTCGSGVWNSWDLLD